MIEPMSVPPPVRVRSKRRTLAIALALLLIPFAVNAVLSVPAPAEAIFTGEMVPVKEVGIEGSVFFSVVRSGIIENWYDRLNLIMAFPDERITFIDIDPQDLEAYEDYFYEEESLPAAVSQAVLEASAYGDAGEGEVDPERFETRTEQLLANLEGYYGNSLGLMIAVGLYEEEHGLDFSDGGRLNISGTGTLEPGGWVGSVGAVEQKLIGAEAAGMDIFFVPADAEWYGEESNEAEAGRVWERYDMSVRVVPVETLDDAIRFLLEL